MKYDPKRLLLSNCHPQNCTVASNYIPSNRDNTYPIQNQGNDLPLTTLNA